MKTKKAPSRSKTKENVALASNNIKLRRCEIKLHRVDGVGGSNRNKRTKSLLQEQQTQNNVADVNRPKRTERKISSNKSASNKEISIQKVKKCVVKLERMKFNTDFNQNSLKPIKKTPISRNPLLALTARRAVELGLKKQPTNIEPPSTSSPTSNEMECSEAQLTFEKNANKTDSSTKTLSPRNLADKPNVINELLSCEDEEFFANATEEQNKIAQSKTVNKFFHKENKNKILNNKPAIIKNTKTTTEKRKKPTNKIVKKKPTVTQQKRSTAKKDIYDFLSQSQTSDSDSKKHKDVASDIVKKLIDEGKVAVARNFKGRPRLKRQPIKKRKKLIEITNKKPVKPTNFEVENIFSIRDDSDDDDHDDRFEEPLALPENVTRNRNQASRNDVVPMANSTFSELARSVLVRKVGNQSQAAHKQLADGRTALEILQRYNSTPFKPPTTSHLPIGDELSPIKSGVNRATLKRVTSLASELTTDINQKANNSKRSLRALPTFSVVPAANSSKRVPENLSFELPTFSDINERSSNDKAKRLLENSTSEQPTCSRINSNKTLIGHTTNLAPLSSFSSNDSNAENQPPPSKPSKSMQTQENLESSTNENNVIHSARQLPNPRRTLTHRSPLKTINIIDIVTLPPYKAPVTSKSKNDENLLHDENKEKSQLFGFEEYLDENAETENEPEKDSLILNNRTRTQSSKLNISKQLRKLKRLRPKSNELSRSTANSTITRNIFNDSGRKVNQNIKEMLCSTMITNRTTAEQQSTLDSTNMQTADCDSDEDSDDSAAAYKRRERKTAELFGDPETSFDQRSFRRTYERPFKRKRKLIHQFSDIFESDHENSDDEQDALNTSVAKEKTHKAKRRHVESPKKGELNKFVTEFNSMLKEAEDYELIVE